MNLKINPHASVAKYQQIMDGLTQLIESGAFKVGDKMPSIEQISKHNKIAKETVVKAYRHMKAKGLIDSTEKKGYFLLTTNTEKKWRVMILFNILTPSKEIIYKSIVNTLQERAHIELFFHNYNFEMFENIIRRKANLYNYFIVMPHPLPESSNILKILPPEKLIVLDRPLLNHIVGASSVHQDFKQDVFDALSRHKDKVMKYKKIITLYPPTKNIPVEIFNGIKAFGVSNKIPVLRREKPENILLEKGTLFITILDDELISLIELIQETKLKIGKDIGIISINENPLKRILAGGIATLSSDFEEMGRTAANCIIKKSITVVRNPFRLIERNSF